jgi:hypothetical protein
VEFINRRVFFHCGQKELLGTINLDRSITMDFFHLHVCRVRALRVNPFLAAAPRQEQQVNHHESKDERN